MNISELKILFIQRVITAYRLDLLVQLCDKFYNVGIITSKGNDTGTLKQAHYNTALDEYNNLKIFQVPSIRIPYKGESRSTSLFLYPKAIKYIHNYDIIVFEGTTNLINNIYLLPYAKLLRKKIIWWDAGYSLPNRTLKRKIIDNVVKPLVKMSDTQMVYSTLAKDYLAEFMGARNIFLNLNTINTEYFENISDEIKKSNNEYQFNKNKIQLLYVGVVEARKRVKELIDITISLNNDSSEKKFCLTIIGGGNQLDGLKSMYEKNDAINLLGPMYDKDELKPHYLKSDLFVLPGDGGLAIVQALLYGLPVVSIKGADGTELDYIKDKDYLVNDIKEIKGFLKGLESIDRASYSKQMKELYSINWIKKLVSRITALSSI